MSIYLGFVFCSLCFIFCLTKLETGYLVWICIYISEVKWSQDKSAMHQNFNVVLIGYHSLCIIFTSWVQVQASVLWLMYCVMQPRYQYWARPSPPPCKIDCQTYKQLTLAQGARSVQDRAADLVKEQMSWVLRTTRWEIMIRVLMNNISEPGDCLIEGDKTLFTWLHRSTLTLSEQHWSLKDKAEHHVWYPVLVWPARLHYLIGL